MFNTEDEILRRLQEKNLEMAVMFYHWCQRNHLTCYLCGGGCIGAIRHGGFIPWDDDLDFFMPIRRRRVKSTSSSTRKRASAMRTRLRTSATAAPRR